MKKMALICSTCAMLVSGAAFAQDSVATINPALIHLTGGDGLDADAYAQGNDHTGGVWEGATGYASSRQVAASVQPQADMRPMMSNRQWSHLNTRDRVYRRSVDQ